MFPFPTILEAEKERDRCFSNNRSARWTWIVAACVVAPILVALLTDAESPRLRLIAVLPIVAGIGLILALIQETRAQNAMKNDPRSFMIGSSREWEELFETLPNLIRSSPDALILVTYTEQWREQTFSLLQKLEDSLKEKKLGLGTPGDQAIDDLIAEFNRLAAASSEKKLGEIANLESIHRVLNCRREIPEA